MTKVVTGFHAIEERVLSFSKNPDAALKISIFYSKAGPRVKKILESAKKAGLSAEQVSNGELDSLVKNLPEELRDHRGIVMQLSGEASTGANLVDFDEWLKTKGSQNGRCTVIILDKVTDPHNTGAILRSCDQFGVDLAVIPEHKSSNDIASNEVIARSSAGASAWVPVAIVNNLVRAAEKLKEAGFWIYGAEAGGQNCSTYDFAEKSTVVMGSEGSGISELLKKQCDASISIPTCGKIDSLNVSVAAGVLMYELYRRHQ